jgi:predicted lipoprotein with Yx(FWY)xxD motif
MKKALIRIVCTFGILLVIIAATALTAIAEEEVHVRTDAEIVGDLGLLFGEGNGLTAEYLAKSTTRLQAAIMFLRLKGLEEEAFAYQAMDNFSDAALVNSSNQSVLAYLKANPELGWAGVGGGKFDPISTITSQQFYKVILEALGYLTGADFEYKDTITFAASMGLSKVAGSGEFVNADIATATVEALKAKIKGSEQTLADLLVEEQVIEAAEASVVTEARVDLAINATLGSYLVDGSGHTLYYFTKDAADMNSCKGACLTNWPVFYSENLQISNNLNKADFGVFVREDGTKQLTYKSWPLYYFAKDLKAGDTLGDNVGKVWFVMKQPFYSVMVATDTELGNYLVDERGMTLYYFDKDTKNMSNCSGACLTNWPAFYSADIVVPTGVSSTDFAVITRADGTKQSTFKGFPLYYFVKDLKMGDTIGQAVNNVWFVVDPVAFTGTTAVPPAKTYKVDMKDYSFSPTELTIEVGASITFTNMDMMEHNAVAVDGSFSTPLLKQGESATVKFDKAGVYNYYCEPHQSFMIGKIIVH